MRKSSSFMCVLVVLLAGGAEASRPLPAEKLFGLIAMAGFASVEASESANCQRFSDIYTNGQDLCERMWDGAFTYEANEDSGYAFWWFEGGSAGAADPIPNPNTVTAQLLGLTPPVVGDQCGVHYYHKTEVSPEPDSFTECHPWHGGSCCSENNVMSADHLNQAYGEGYQWDRCGPLSSACERFFVQEACFYECEPTAGLYRAYSDEQHDACVTFESSYSYGISSPAGTVVTLGDGSSYTCTGSENRWQISGMPIKASHCDAWYRACAEDFFCGGGSYFGCAASYEDEVERLAREAEELRANLTAAAEQEEAMIEAQEESEALRNDLEDEKKKEIKLPPWAVIVIIAGIVVGVLLCIFTCVMIKQEKAGKPVFTTLGAEAKPGPAAA